MGFGGGGFWILAIGLIVAGALALAEIIKKKNPQAGEAVEKIAKYQGYIGIGLLAVSIWNLLAILRWLSFLLKALPISTIVLIAALGSGILLGLSQGISLFKNFGILSDEKAGKIEGKLTGIKIPLGFIAVSSAVYLILWRLIGWRF